MFDKLKKQMSNREFLHYLRVEYPQEYTRRQEMEKPRIYGMKYFW